MNRIVIALTISSALALSACKKEPPVTTPPPPADVSTPTPTPAPAPVSNPPGSQAHFASAMSGADTIYFETDRYNIDNEDMAALRRQAEYMLQYNSSTATVEGHADERGTRDYNLALGERRANSAKNYLVSLGVPENRLRTVSYGEERPIATGSDESAWARNRRSVTVMISR
ncbi:peptidoglycan-associated lipoprotein [Aurantiacibacter atlanticus]|uniref:Peptidoglycan-associated lipoprotein n=1 Tax=Aurantiacibacter atlanticus TaxID=1648404 RepID=A0A0H4VIM4_9SPHN|nr:peptidoglycan-associated lipoprotein Pal [Aurantiacibacter atlanticus]AKQ42726.1 peptidoglycan-associated lipoprotein [Aurantiacibacter atlanticus]MDF1834468.1 peptidoglycan-associated lipoprotein Pal [Alteraurantiacibacter sp. bin_em_oilr2.035]